MSKQLYCVLAALCIGICVGQSTNPCLYSSASNKVLLPLTMTSSNCPSNTSYCMNVAYKYSNFQYNGPPLLKPDKGEIVMFLAKYPDADGTYHLVTMLNANVTTTMSVTMSMTGTGPANIELYDDPIGSTDSWQWDPSTNSGQFSWVTQPTYTDGCVIGPITFVDNYCIKAIFNQPNNAIQKISVMSGTSSNPSKIITATYISGSTFEFCQYPQTVTWKKDVTCPGLSNGAANISIAYGPSSATYAWKNSNGTTISTGQSISNVKAGTYMAYVTDTSSNHCNAVRTVVISQPSPLYVATLTTTPYACTTLGSANATAAGGSGGYMYTYMKGAMTIGSGPNIMGLGLGTYTLMVTDSCGTTTSTTFTISTIGCCGDGICQSNEACANGGNCPSDCGTCCPAGTYTVNSTCVVCPAGSYSTMPGSTSCTSCPQNTYNAGGNDACTPCPDNTMSSSGSGVCYNCAAGTIRAGNESACHSCGAGSVPSCGSAMCMACPTGTYAANNWDKCQACAAGMYASQSGSSSCSPCAAGTYAAAGSSSCTPCPVGTSSSAGSSHSLACM